MRHLLAVDASLLWILVVSATCFFHVVVKFLFHVFAMCVSNFGHVLRHVEKRCRVHYQSWNGHIVERGFNDLGGRFWTVHVQFLGCVFARIGQMYVTFVGSGCVVFMDVGRFGDVFFPYGCEIFVPCFCHVRVEFRPRFEACTNAMPVALPLAKR